MHPLEKPEIARQVEEEHEAIKRAMDDIRDAIASDDPSSNFPQWHLDFIWRLRDFRLHLLRHFDLEEEGGFMSDIVARAPETSAKVAELENEHEDIVDYLDTILKTLKKVETWDELREHDVDESISALLDLIRKHEATENQLIQKAYCREYGYPS